MRKSQASYKCRELEQGSWRTAQRQTSPWKRPVPNFIALRIFESVASLQASFVEGTRLHSRRVRLSSIGLHSLEVVAGQVVR